MSGIEEARELGKQNGYFNPAQYENSSNPRAYEKWVAPQIVEQTGGKLSVFAAGLGTTGTMVGASRYFRREMNSKVTLVGVMCSPNQAVPGVRSEARLKEISFDWRCSSDSIVEVGTKESFKTSLALCRCGLVAGPSSGFALAGLQQFLELQNKNGNLDSLRNQDGEVLAVFICPDTPLPYLDKYSTHLDAADF